MKAMGAIAVFALLLSGPVMAMQEMHDNMHEGNQVKQQEDDQAQEKMKEGEKYVQDAMKVIEDWPEGPKKEATRLIENYGEPSGVTDSRLIWDNPPEPWHEIIVYRDTVQHNFPVEHQDFLEYAILYPVPVDKYDDLAEFDGSVFAERTTGRLAARCDFEGGNLIALNLAHQIITGETTVDEARKTYAETVKKFKEGEQPELMTELQFEAEDLDQARDPDQGVEPAA